MADLGFISLILALTLSIYCVIAFVLGAIKGYSRLISIARKAILAACGFVLLAVYVLYYALLSHDFQLEYVYLHTSLDMPLIYNISAFWAGNAGSLLFMALFLSLFATVVTIRKQKGGERFSAYISAVITGTIAFLLILLILAANPFEKLHSVPSDGIGLNPILENPGMVIHPPLLLAGYIAFTVPFALAIAALITKNEDRDWLPRTRMWTLLAWLLLGVGNLIGAWWAYVELGWGGYWAWDPVENAGLMPWLVGTALLHSMSTQRKTRMLKVWTIILIITAFNLCIFGSFLTRSDFLSSVHTFASTGMETIFLVFLSITLIGPLILVLSRRSYLRGEKREGSLISKENSFILTNILFVTATLVIFFGTMFPWLSERIAGSITTLESSFFDKAVGPIFLLIILIAGICILLSWRRTSFLKFVRQAVYPILISLILCLVLYLVGIKEWYALTLYPLCCFVIISHLFILCRDVIARSRIKEINPLKALAHLLWVNRPHYGGMVVHLGIALIAIGIIGSSFYQSEAEVALQPGDSMTVENYTLTYEDLTFKETPTRVIFTARLSVYDGDRYAGVLTPEKYFHFGSGSTASEVDISPMPHWWLPVEDLYVILAYWTTDGTTTFQVLVNPLVNLIWIGGGVLTLGGLFAFLPYRRRKGSASEDEGQTEERVVNAETVTTDNSTSFSSPESLSEAALESDVTDLNK